MVCTVRRASLYTGHSSRASAPASCDRRDACDGVGFAKNLRVFGKPNRFETAVLRRQTCRNFTYISFKSEDQVLDQDPISESSNFKDKYQERAFNLRARSASGFSRHPVGCTAPGPVRARARVRCVQTAVTRVWSCAGRRCPCRWTSGPPPHGTPDRNSDGRTAGPLTLSHSLTTSRSSHLTDTRQSHPTRREGRRGRGARDSAADTDTTRPGRAHAAPH